MAPTKTDPVEARTKALLARDEEERLERTREAARHEIENEQRAQEEQRATRKAQDSLRAMDPAKALDGPRENAVRALEEYAAAIDGWNGELQRIRDELTESAPTADLELTRRATRVGDVEVVHVGVQDRFSRIVTDVLKATRPRELITLDVPPGATPRG